MRFVRIVVKNFQALESADVEFGPGLNIIFGPNDLGKSTLASAIRAALLIRPSSAEATAYCPWFLDAVPEVALTFQDDNDRYWRVRKSFGTAASQATAELQDSKDGANFSLVCRSREVEEELRKLLAWGLPSPGGKGAPRGLPTSFLSHVLLAGQTDVETIFGRSLENDGAASGKDRLRKALAALAEDPRFKTILAEVQKKVTEYFSPSGLRKKGRESPFALAAEEIKRRTDRVDDLKMGVTQSESTEELIGRLRESYSSANEAHETASTVLEDVRRQRLRADARSLAEREHSTAAEVVSALARQAQEVLDRQRELPELLAQVETAERQAVEARYALESADLALREAEQALRAASNDEQDRQRELLRAQLGAERAELSVQTGQTQKRFEALLAAQTADVSARGAVTADADARDAADRAHAREAAAESARANAERELELARGLLTYGHWQAARQAGKRAQEAKDKAEALRAEGSSKEKGAEEKESQAVQKVAEGNALRGTLPDPALTTRLERLSHDLAIAEAALGGGFSVAVRGSGKIPLHVSLDGRDAIAGTAIDGRLVFEADRAAVLRAGDMLDIEIVAGAADQRRALEALRERWTNEAEPILTRAGVATVPEIRERLGEATALDTTAEGLQREAKQLRTQAESYRQAAEVQDQRTADLLASAGEAHALESKLAGSDLAILATRFTELGPAWKQHSDDFVNEKDRALSLARDELAAASRERDLATLRATDAAARATTARAEFTRGLNALAIAETDSTSVSLVTTIAETEIELEALSSQLASIGDRLDTLNAEVTNAVTTAQAAVESAQTGRARTLSEQTHRIQIVNEARSRSDIAHGHFAALQAALLAIDCAGAKARLTAAAAALEQYAGDASVPADALQVAEHRESHAENALAQVRRDLDQAEGALTKVGGAPLREELRREQEALELAKKQQRDLELESDSWQLLRETLQEAEKDGATHLGRSLAGPVSARLVELTGGHYNGLRLDQHLKVEGVDVAAAANSENVLDALSVGTRDQIATLLRLTIAEQLGSSIILDDHLVHTDPERLKWFRRALREAAMKTQVVVITCRPEDYLQPAEPSEDPRRAAVRAIEFGRVARRFTSVVMARPTPQPSPDGDSRR